VSHVVPDLGHRRRRLTGRDPHEPHRAATPLELLYDLVFVVAFGQAADELAHYVAEGDGAERYGLLVIITLGEGIIGTVASLSAVVNGPAGWSADAALVALAGVGLTFGMWWMYFAMPSGDVLDVHPERVFFWAYGHIVIFGSLAAVGAGLHVAAYYLEHLTTIGAVGTVLSAAVPLAVYVLALFALWTTLLRLKDPFHIGLLIGTAAVLVLAVVLAQAGVSMAWCLVVLALAPVVTVVGYETLGHRHQEAALTRMRQVPQPTGTS